MEELTFNNIKLKINKICIDLMSYVNVDEHDYTHQPSKRSIMLEVEDCVSDLNKLKSDIKLTLEQ